MNGTIPIVDLRSIGIQHATPTPEDLGSVGAALERAFADIGFVYLTGHGVEQAAVDAVTLESGAFFAAPDSVKAGFSRGVQDSDGYSAVGREKLAAEAGRVELRETYDVTNLDAGFPDAAVPGFRPAVTALLGQMQRLALRLLAALEQALGVSEGRLLSAHACLLKGSAHNATTLRILHYPPVPRDAPSGAVRCGAHTDYGTFTILGQDNLGGLEVQNRLDQWVAATPVPGALLVNVGDLLALWTNGRLRATLHRVRVPQSEQLQQKARRSLAFFVHPDNAVLMTPLDGTPCERPVTALQHVTRRFAESYDY